MGIRNFFGSRSSAILSGVRMKNLFAPVAMPLVILNKSEMLKARNFTLKALANSSPGLGSGNPGEKRVPSKKTQP
jgi:hypothetical protein